MAAKKEEMEALWCKLDEQTSAGQIKKAAKTVDSILQIDNLNAIALRAKGVLLVQGGKHDELLKLLDKPSGKTVAAELVFERAYCLYRLGRFQEALDTVNQVEEGRTVAKLHLQAQLYHRLGRSRDCIAAYSDLSSKHNDQSLELRANVLAAYVENGRADEIPEVMEVMKISGDKSYEIAFNKACGLLAAGAMAEAEEQLLLAQRIGQETLYSEDFTEEEVEEEMAPVKAQLAYVAGQLGRMSEAADLTEELVKVIKNDPATRAVSESNLAAAKVLDESRKSGVGESIKRLDALLAKPGVFSQLELQPELQLRLTPEQQLALHRNRAVLMMQMGRMDQAQQVVQAMVAAFPGSTDVSLLQASLMGNEGRIDEAAKMLADTSEPSLDTLLMSCQLLAPSSPERAADLLGSSSDPELLFSPAVIATQLALYRRANATEKIGKLITAATSVWQSKPDNKEALAFLLEAKAQSLMETGEVQEASRCLTELRDKYCPDDMSLLVKLVKTTAIFDSEAAARLGEALPPIESSEPVDVEAELQAIVAKSRGKDERKKDATGELKTKKKRKRKPILPKGFDPANPGPLPNPERWLPKHERSDYRKKKRGQHLRAQQTNIRGSQGAGKVDENLDRSSAAAQGIAGASSSGGQQDKGKSGKQKKKGKR